MRGRHSPTRLEAGSPQPGLPDPSGRAAAFPVPRAGDACVSLGLCPCQIALGRGLGHVCRTLPHRPRQPDSQASAGARGASRPPPPVWLGALSWKAWTLSPGPAQALHIVGAGGDSTTGRDPAEPWCGGPASGAGDGRAPSSSGLPRSPSMLAVTRWPAKAPSEARVLRFLSLAVPAPRSARPSVLLHPAEPSLLGGLRSPWAELD